MLSKLEMNSGCIIAIFRSDLERQRSVKIFLMRGTVRGARGHPLCVEEMALGENV